MRFDGRRHTKPSVHDLNSMRQSMDGLERRVDSHDLGFWSSDDAATDCSLRLELNA